jgi:hypothetical protein
VSGKDEFSQVRALPRGIKGLACSCYVLDACSAQLGGLIEMLFVLFVLFSMLAGVWGRRGWRGWVMRFMLRLHGVSRPGLVRYRNEVRSGSWLNGTSIMRCVETDTVARPRRVCTGFRASFRGDVYVWVRLLTALQVRESITEEWGITKRCVGWLRQVLGRIIRRRKT